MTDEGTTDLTTRLTSAERERLWPNVRPLDAATLIVQNQATRADGQASP
jgi:hypothetical protein